MIAGAIRICVQRSDVAAIHRRDSSSLSTAAQCRRDGFGVDAQTVSEDQRIAPPEVAFGQPIENSRTHFSAVASALAGRRRYHGVMHEAEANSVSGELSCFSGSK